MMRSVLLKKLASFFLLLILLAAFSAFLNTRRGGSALITLTGQRVDAEQLKQLEKQFAYESNWQLAFFKTLRAVFTFDFGVTIKGIPVFELIWPAFFITAQLALLASFFSLGYGVALGVISRLYPRSEPWLLKINYLLLSVPVFISGLFLIWVFALYLNWLPPGGQEVTGWFVLPALALGMKTGSRIAIFTNNFIKKEAGKSYILMLESLKVSRRRIYFVHLLSNTALPILSLWLLEFSSFIAGAAIIETIFSLPGLGSLVLSSLQRYDFNLLNSILLFTALLIFLVGLAQEFIDLYYRKRTVTV